MNLKFYLSQGISDLPLFKLIEKLIIAVLVISVFLYPANFGPTRLENFFMPLMVLVLLLRKHLRFDRFLIYLLVINMLIGYTSVVLNLNMNHGLMESLRWVKYIMVVVLFSSMAKEHFKFVLVCFEIAFIAMIVINLLQLFNPMNLGVKIASYYSHHPLYSGDAESLDRTFRLIGTAINPNNNALLWLLMGLFFLFDFHNHRNIKPLIFVLLSFVFIIFTQSRTALVAGIVMGFLNIFLYRLKVRDYIFLAATVLMGVIITIFFNFTYIWQLFLYNPLKLHSMKLRFAIWRDMWVYYLERPILGWGNPRNYEVLYSKSADNEFLYILLNTGAIGLFGIIVIFIYSFFTFYRQRKTFKFSYLPLFMIICFLIVGLTNVTIINVRMGLFFFMMWGLTYSFRFNSKPL